VRVWGPDGVGPADWGPPATFETGLLDPGEWTARFVGAPADADLGQDPEVIAPSPYLRREFSLDGAVRQARLYVSALGVYEVRINGRPVNDHVLPPGWTSYDHRLRYETIDVTDLLQPGANAIGAILGEGWFRGTIGWEGGKRNIYGDRLALLAQLEIVGADGETTTIVTDESWRVGTGAVVSSGLYAGEVHDARREPQGWSSTGFGDESWSDARAVERDLTTLVARVGPPVRRTDGLHPTQIVTSPAGRTILDFGQNLVGRLRLRIPRAEAGTTITLRHAEVLQDGELCTAPLRLAEATDRLTLAGSADDPDEPGSEWEPRFTFHGFRYAEIDGWPASVELTPDDVTAQVCHSDMERTGWFTCSDDRINRLHENIVWGMRGNFLDVPTDCPQRDERLGWTGDIQVFTPTACFLYDCAGFLASWLGDLAAEQADDGAVPFIIPNSLPFTIAAAAWGDAATIVPDHVAFAAGDDGLLRDQYPSMRAWVDHVVAAAGDNRLWDSGFQFGDWLDPRAPAKDPADGRTDAHLVASAYLVRSLDIVAATAERLGRAHGAVSTSVAAGAGPAGEAEPADVADRRSADLAHATGDRYQADAERYRKLAAEVRDAFQREYVTPNGRLASDSQTAYALALELDLLATAAERAHAGRRLGKLVDRAGHKIATGFVGTPLICDALCRSGQVDKAYQLLLQTECPSWLYPVTQGATTIWERWDGIQPDGTIDPDSLRMNSFNHYALGAVGDWLHRSVGGLAPAAPGWREVRIEPLVSRLDGAPTSATSRHLTPYGPASSSWERDGDTLTLTAVVPPNTTATVVLPGTDDAPQRVGSGTHTWTVTLPPIDPDVTGAGTAADADADAEGEPPGAGGAAPEARTEGE
jgi:alpha-L-rhamnosidase